MSIRLNPNILPDLLAAIERTTQSLTTSTEQLSSGRAVNQLSDNPAAVANLVGNHNQAGQDDQFLQNIATLQSRFQVADTAASNVVTILTRAISLGTQGATGTVSASGRQAIASEVQGLTSQMLSLANTIHQGAYIFAGTAVKSPPFVLDSATNTVSYVGNSGTTSVQLSTGNSRSANVPGDQIFQNAAGDVFGALQDLNSSLLSGTGIPAAVTEVQNALSQVSTQRVFYGNALNQISLSESFLNQDKINLSSQENVLIGIDPARAASNLVQAQTANQSVLAATARILNLQTLLDLIR